jgi:hypothetical protein
MADDLDKTGEQDDERINVDQHHELSYWSDKLGVSRDKLRETVARVGPMRQGAQSQLRASYRAAADELRLTTPKSAKRRRRRKGPLKVRVIDGRREFCRD